MFPKLPSYGQGCNFSFLIFTKDQVFLKLLVYQPEFVLKRYTKTGNHCGWLLALSSHLHSPKCSAGPSTFSPLSALPQQPKITCYAHKWSKLLCPREECGALPVDILGGHRKREGKQEVFHGLESWDMQGHPMNIPELSARQWHMRNH